MSKDSRFFLASNNRKQSAYAANAKLEILN